MSAIIPSTLSLVDEARNLLTHSAETQFSALFELAGAATLLERVRLSGEWTTDPIWDDAELIRQELGLEKPIARTWLRYMRLQKLQCAQANIYDQETYSAFAALPTVLETLQAVNAARADKLPLPTSIHQLKAFVPYVSREKQPAYSEEQLKALLSTDARDHGFGQANQDQSEFIEAWEYCFKQSINERTLRAAGKETSDLVVRMPGRDACKELLRGFKRLKGYPESPKAAQVTEVKTVESAIVPTRSRVGESRRNTPRDRDFDVVAAAREAREKAEREAAAEALKTKKLDELTVEKQILERQQYYLEKLRYIRQNLESVYGELKSDLAQGGSEWVQTILRSEIVGALDPLKIIGELRKCEMTLRNFCEDITATDIEPTQPIERPTIEII